MGKIISVSNQKGGVGKTTTAVNLSAALSAKGKKVLLIDTDPQANSTSGVGIDKRNIKISSYNMLIEKSSAKDAVIKTEFKNLSVIASDMNLSAAEIEMASFENRERILKTALAEIRGNYDYILIDCPPSLGLITTNALCASDTVLIPIQCEYYALEGLSQLMNSIRRVKRQFNENLDLEGVLLTMFDGRLNLTQQVVAEIKKFFPKKVFSTVIPRTVRISEAPSFGQPILYYDKSNKGTEAYNNLADEIIKKNR
ncbi:MAG: AAA family ATPase [Clostridia bacterium]